MLAWFCDPAAISNFVAFFVIIVFCNPPFFFFFYSDGRSGIVGLRPGSIQADAGKEHLIWWLLNLFYPTWGCSEQGADKDVNGKGQLKHPVKAFSPVHLVILGLQTAIIIACIVLTLLCRGWSFFRKQVNFLFMFKLRCKILNG